MFQFSRVEAILHDARHFDQSRGHHGAAGFGGAEKRFFVHLLGLVRVPNENQLDALVAAGKKHMEQHEKTLRQILHMLGHRTRDIHKTEHDGLRDGFWKTLKATIPQIDRIEICDAHSSLALERQASFRQSLGVCSLRSAAAASSSSSRLIFWLRGLPSQCAARETFPSFVPEEDWPGLRPSFVPHAGCLDLHADQTPLGKVGQFQIIQKNAEKFLTREHETNVSA